MDAKMKWVKRLTGVAALCTVVTVIMFSALLLAMVAFAPFINQLPGLLSAGVGHYEPNRPMDGSAHASATDCYCPQHSLRDGSGWNRLADIIAGISAVEDDDKRNGDSSAKLYGNGLDYLWSCYWRATGTQ